MTIAQLNRINPNHKAKNAEFYTFLANGFQKYNLTTKERQSAFLASVLHESAGFSMLEENLNYTTEARVKLIFGKRITLAKR